MSSQTPNINLIIPTGTEHVSRQIINDNNTKIDTAVGALNGKLFKVASENITSSNIGNYTQNGIYVGYIDFNGILGITGSNNSYGLLIVSTPKTAERIGQYIYSPLSGLSATRYYNGSSWSSWNRKFDIVSVLNNITYNTSALQWQECTRAQVGNIVSYQCSVKALTAISADAVIARGFTSNINTYSICPNCSALDDNKNTYHVYMISTDGEVHCLEPIATGRILRFTLTYIVS